MDTVEFTELIKSRRSIRAWEDKPVPEELLKQAVELATWAPNGANAQIWRFYIVLDKTKIKAIGKALQASMNEMGSWPEMANFKGFPPAPGFPKDSPPAQPKRSPLGEAPAAIFIGAQHRINPFDQILEERAKIDEKAAEKVEWNKVIDSKIQSVSSGIAYLTLILHQFGLCTTWMTGPISRVKEEIEKILDVPDDVDIIAMLPVGYSSEKPSGFRRPLEEVCWLIK